MSLRSASSLAVSPEAFQFFYVPLCPASRKVRLILGEKGLTGEWIEEAPTARSEAVFAAHHEGGLPLFKDKGRVFVRDYAIQEYLEEAYPSVSLLGKTVGERAEVRRLTSWFDVRLNREVVAPLLTQKVFKRARGRRDPDSHALQAAKSDFYNHMDYISWLVDRRNWLAGANLSLADLAAASQLSCLDYLGDIPWEKYPGAKAWYVRLKSRPSFRPLLVESFAGLIPARHYRLLDF